MEDKISQLNPNIHFPNKLPLVSNLEAKGNNSKTYFLIFIKFLILKIKIKNLS